MERGKFEAAIQEVTHTLDTQKHTRLMGNFNGFCLHRDFQCKSDGRREVCAF